MANKKKAKKKAAKPAAAEAPVENNGEGEEVEAEPAHVEEATIQVRGAGVGGVKMMTKTEHDAYCKRTSGK